MANLNAILKNKMGLSAEQAKKSKVLASLSGSYRQNMKSIHYTQLVSNINQFYSEKELENLADVIQILGGVAQNLLVRKKDAEQYEILAGHRRQAAVKRQSEWHSICFRGRYLLWTMKTK